MAKKKKKNENGKLSWTLEKLNLTSDPNTVL